MDGEVNFLSSSGRGIAVAWVPPIRLRLLCKLKLELSGCRLIYHVSSNCTDDKDGTYMGCS